MATTVKKPRTSQDSLPQLSTLPERVAVLEFKMDDIKTDMTSNHETLLTTLKEMRETSVAQHVDMAKKIQDLEGFKNKWLKYGMMALAFAAGAGWIRQDLSAILKFVGL